MYFFLKHIVLFNRIFLILSSFHFNKVRGYFVNGIFAMFVLKFIIELIILELCEQPY